MRAVRVRPVELLPMESILPKRRVCADLSRQRRRKVRKRFCAWMKKNRCWCGGTTAWGARSHSCPMRRIAGRNRGFAGNRLAPCGRRWCAMFHIATAPCARACGPERMKARRWCITMCWRTQAIPPVRRWTLQPRRTFWLRCPARLPRTIALEQTAPGHYEGEHSSRSGRSLSNCFREFGIGLARRLAFYHESGWRQNRRRSIQRCSVKSATHHRRAHASLH